MENVGGNCGSAGERMRVERSQRSSFEQSMRAPLHGVRGPTLHQIPVNNNVR